MKRSRTENNPSGPVAAIGALALAALAACQPVWAGAFTPGNFVAYRVGAGSGVALSVYLDEYRPDGTLVQTVALGNGFAASDKGSEGLLNRSANGQCLTVPGYAVAPGTAAPNDAKASDAPRSVAFVAVDTSVNYATKFGSSAFNKDTIRGAVSSDCTQAWASGKGSSTNSGVWYAALNSTSGVQLTQDNTQGIAITDGQLHAAVNGATLSTVGPGLPSSGGIYTPAALSGVTNSTYRGIAFLNLNGSASADTVYVADNDTSKVVKFSLSGGTWSKVGEASTSSKTHGLIALDTGEGNVMLFATDSSGKAYRLFDRSGYGGALSGNFETLATPSAGAFYGLAWAPEATPPSAAPIDPANLSVSAIGNSVTASWDPVAGAAWYVVEVSAGAAFDASATQGVGQTLITATPAATLSGLAEGAHTLRVRAVNSAGGSAGTVSQPFTPAAPPTSTLPATTAYSGVIGDATDPLATLGVTIPVGDATDVVSAASNNTAVVLDTNLVVSGSGTSRTLKVTPTGVGYADITVTITNAGGASITRTIKYAASAHVAGTAGTRWYTGRSDGSTAIVLDADTLLVGDDEAPDPDASGNAAQSGGGNAFSAYAPGASGLPLTPLSPDSALGLRTGKTGAECTSGAYTGVADCDADGEVDIEASFAASGTLYVAGSHSNSKKGKSRPDRWRFMALTASGSGSGTALAVTGYYKWLREDLRTWDSGNVHGLGPNYFGVADSSAGGSCSDAQVDSDSCPKAPETGTLSGFSIEGMASSPGDTAAWLGFRAPLVSAPGAPAVAADSATGRTHALIVPVTNYASLPGSTGGAKNTATFGAPVRLDLGGRGIREIRKNGAGEYLIIAGSASGSGKSFVLYTWDGSVNAAGLALNLRLRATDLSAFTKPTTDCAAEGIGTLPTSLDAGGHVDVISDCGDADFYGDGKAAKDLPYAAWKKFRADVVALPALSTVTLAPGQATAATLPFTASAPQPGTLYAVALPQNAPAPSWEQVKAGRDGSGAAAAWAGSAALSGSASLTATGLAASTGYTLHAVVVEGNGGYASALARQNLATAAPGPVLAPQTIAFGTLAARLLGTAPFTLGATGGGSGNPVVFSSTTTTVCTVAGSTVTLVATGTCTVQADQAGNASFAAAPSVPQSFQVAAPAASGTSWPGSGGVGGAVAGNTWQFAANSQGFQPVAGLPDVPGGYAFPYGMFGFALVNGTPGSSATVSLNLPQPAPAGVVLWKYGRQTPGGAPAWYQVAPVFSNGRSTVSFTVTDGPGSTGDDDQVANGVIIDPVLLGAPPGGGAASATAIPTLGEWARGLLALALAGLAALRLRARRA
ncbi:MAG: DUF3616 domain-containing protein [Comamonadaceae bacterium]|nr:DUF3616 domain-containing protein [Comamonadaceae bacterium]